MPLHLAFSAGHFVDKAGNIGGFAAIVGLAVLVLLYFSQARELKRLREWAAEAPERAAELEQRLMASVRRGAPQPASARAGVARPATPAGASSRPAAAPFAPVGVGAPALASATRFPGLVPARPAPAPVAAPAPAAVPAAAQAGGGGTTTAAPPVPATSNGRSGDATAITPPPAAAPPRGPATPPPERRSVQIRGQAAPLRAGAPATATPRKRTDPHGRRWAILMGIGVIVIVVLVALLVTGTLGGSGGGGKAKSAGSSQGAGAATPAKKTKAKAKAKPTPFVRKNTTVSVINGTFATGIAGQTENKLQSKGFGSGVASTGADQTHSATVIYYQPGHKRDAQEVKRVLGQGAVEPIGGQNPAASVCAVKQGQPNPCGTGVDVVVVVGSDRTQ
jgi:hypothetical protein